MRVSIGIGLAAASLLTAGCAGRPAVRYQASDANVRPGERTEWTFDADPAGGLPAGVEVYDGDWSVRAEEDAPSPPHVLRQGGRATFPALCLADKVYVDLEATLRFKPVSGREDQAAGVLFRIQDRNNYYILRANALEGNVNFYLYASGVRSEIKGGSARVDSGRWQELRVEVEGDRFRGYLDGRLVVEAEDNSYKAGKVGLWTKADSVTCFDDVRVTAK
jgi:hypothetical protein